MSRDGGPAFPSFDEHSEPMQVALGMTLRDYFAANAMQGLLAGVDDRSCHSSTPDGIEAERAAFMRDYAASAYRAADAMLAERERGGK